MLFSSFSFCKLDLRSRPLTTIDIVYTVRYALYVGDAVEFDWDDENTKHLAAHKVTRAEFEQAMNSDPIDLDCEVIDDEDRYRAVGLTDNGAFLLLVYTIRNGKVRAVTAFPASASNRRSFLEKR
jgi:uncharacterized DUF497 family protein